MHLESIQNTYVLFTSYYVYITCVDEQSSSEHSLNNSHKSFVNILSVNLLFPQTLSKRFHCWEIQVQILKRKFNLNLHVTFSYRTLNTHLLFWSCFLVPYHYDFFLWIKKSFDVRINFANFQYTYGKVVM